MGNQVVEKDNWTSVDEKFFFERYEKLGKTDKQHNLVNKALELILQFGKSKCEAATRILEKYFKDFGTEEKSDCLTSDDNREDILDEAAKEAILAHSVAFLVQGKIHYLKYEYDKCFECFGRVVAIEAKTKLNASGWLNYAEFVIKFKKTEYYEQAEQLLIEHYENKDFELDYITNVLLSKIAEERQDSEKCKYYADIVKKMLEDAAKETKPLYFNAVKRNNIQVDLTEEMEVFLKSKKFRRETDTNPSSWIRNGFCCQQHLIFVQLFDVVIIKAFIYFNDIMTGQPQVMGLDGFIACTGKLPFKKIVKKLEKLIEQIG